MLTIRRRMGGDLSLQLVCCVCRKSLRVREAWLGFRAPTDAHPTSEGRWLHRTCLDGQAQHLFGDRHVTLWRGRDVIEQLMRATEGDGMAGGRRA